MIKKLFPDFKTKALCLSYDDGVTQDVRLIELLRKYNLTATFNLNSHLSDIEFQWTHNSGVVVTRLPVKVLSELYKGFEVASHTCSHPYMDNLTEAEISREMTIDKDALEKITGHRVCGFAVPFHYYSSLIRDCAVNCGFEYSRCSDVTYSFEPWDDYFSLKATAFHLDNRVDNLIEDFLNSQQELPILHLIGHSYDLDTHNAWDKFESFFHRMSTAEDVLSATTIHLVRYIKAMDKVQITDTLIINNSELELYFDIDGVKVSVKPDTTYNL